MEIGRLRLVEIDFGSLVSFAGRPMKRKEQYIARLDEVTITREGDSAVIRYKEEGIMTTHLKSGAESASSSDEANLELFNDTLRAQDRLIAHARDLRANLQVRR